MEPEPTTIEVADAPQQQTHTIANQALTVDMLNAIPPEIKSLVLISCTSKQWLALFKKIAELKQLEQLTLSGCRFSKDHLPPLEKSALKKLTLIKTSFEDYDLVKLRIPTLTHLVMTDNPINKSKQAVPVFQARWQNRQLKTLKMPIPELSSLVLARKDNDPTSVDVTSNNLPTTTYNINLLKMDMKLVLNNFPDLVRLTLTNLDSIDNQLECIADLRQLKVLHLDKTAIRRDTLLDIITNLSNLIELDLTACKCIDSEIVSIMIHRMRKLKRLFLGETNISDQDGLRLCYGFPKATWLSARQNQIGKRGDRKMKALLPRATVWAD